MKKTKIIKVFGRVQNVGFRFATVEKARELNVTGFVKNMPDRTVYIEAQGSDLQLELFFHWCNEGPSWAHVEKVVVSEAQAIQYFEFKKL